MRQSCRKGLLPADSPGLGWAFLEGDGTVLVLTQRCPVPFAHPPPALHFPKTLLLLSSTLTYKCLNLSYIYRLLCLGPPTALSGCSWSFINHKIVGPHSSVFDFDNSRHLCFSEGSVENEENEFLTQVQLHATSSGPGLLV